MLCDSYDHCKRPRLSQEREDSSIDGRCLGRQHCTETYLEQLRWLAQHHRRNLNFVKARVILEKIISLELAAVAQEEEEENGTSNRDSLINLMVSHTNLATLCQETGLFDDAIYHHNAALNLYMAGSPSCHSSAALAVSNLRYVASIYIRFRMKYEALKCYSFIYDIQQQFEAVGMVPKAEVASTVSCMGLMNYLLRKYEESLRFYQEELHLRLEIQNGRREGEDIANSLNSIGIVHFQLHRLDEAERAFRECLLIRQSLLGDIMLLNSSATETSTTLEIKKQLCFDLSMIYYNLGGICIRRGDTEGASALYQRSMELKKGALGDNLEIAVDFQHLGQTFLERGDVESSIGYYKEALKIVQALDAEDEPTDAEQKLLVIIGNIHLMEGNVPDSMTCFQVAARATHSTNDDFTEVCCTFGFHYYSMSRLHPKCAPMA